MKKYKKILIVLEVILIANVLVAIVKVFLGIKLKSNSLTADGFHAITDSTSNIIGIIGINIASRPADKKHPYGYQKFETIASMIIGIMLIYISGQIVFQSISWFLKPVIPRFSLPGIITLIITLLINIFIAIYEYKKGKSLNSEVLVSDSIHTRSDVLISLGVISSIILIKIGLPAIIDPILALIIAMFVLKSAYEILKPTIAILVDKNVIDENEVIKIILESNSDIINIHKIRSRGKDNLIYIDMHIIVDGTKTVKEAHDLTHHIQDILKEKYEKIVELICHIEPDELSEHHHLIHDKLIS